MIHLGLVVSSMMILFGAVMYSREVLTDRVGRYTRWDELTPHQLDCVGIILAGIVLTITAFVFKS